MPGETSYRVAVTAGEPPDAAGWEAGELFEDVGTAVRRAAERAGELCRADELGFVWVGHCGVSCSGSSHAAPGWRVLIRQPPPGWPDPERERQAAAYAAWLAAQDAAADARKNAKAAAAAARKAAGPVKPRDTSMDAIR